ncbi:MAG: hypothetical protein DWQ05_01750 [Calditrichaeota bacterium]|nr:MAG: hypothetical protein DWQ05_01750 [Calditrichota bacterium]
MQRFCRFFVANRKLFLIGLLIFMLYGFPSCCDEDSAVNGPTNENCDYIIEEDGIIFQTEVGEATQWGFLIEKESGDEVFALSDPLFLPRNNLPSFLRSESLKVHIVGVAVPPDIENPINQWATPLLILRINTID